MAYATTADVEVYLNRAFEGDQEAAAQLGVDAASDHIDRVTGLTWVAGPVVGEVHQVVQEAATTGQLQFRLERPPVGSVELFLVRDPYLGAPTAELASPGGYELLDPSSGLAILAAQVGAIVTVDYTSAPIVPDDIRQATVMIAAEWLGPALSSASLLYQRLRAGSAEIEFRAGDIPSRAQSILDAYTSSLVFA